MKSLLYLIVCLPLLINGPSFAASNNTKMNSVKETLYGREFECVKSINFCLGERWLSFDYGNDNMIFFDRGVPARKDFMMNITTDGDINSIWMVKNYGKTLEKKYGAKSLVARVSANCSEKLIRYSDMTLFSQYFGRGTIKEVKESDNNWMEIRPESIEEEFAFILCSRPN